MLGTLSYRIFIFFAFLIHIFCLGIFSAGLSTISAALNSLAAVTLEDYLKPAYKKCCGKEISLTMSTTVAKLLAFLYGIISIALAFLAQLLGGVLQVFFFFNLFYYRKYFQDFI